MPPAEPDESSSADRSRELDSHLVRGIAWTGMSRLASQMVSWGSFLIVARILAPGDIGVTAAAASVVGFVALLAEFGLGSAIVAKVELKPEELSQLAGIAVGTAALAWLIIALMGWPAAQMMRMSELTQVLPLLGLTVALSTVLAIPSAVMRRNMAFRGLSKLEMGRSVIAAIASLGLALAGFRFWAPLLADLLSNIFLTAALFRATGLKLRKPQWSGVADAIAFSREVLVSRAAWYAYSNADFIVVSRQLGKAALGDYSMAWTMINLPSEKVATLLFAVTPSILARVRDDLVEFRRYVLLLFESLGMVLMPTAAGIGLVAADGVRVALGEKWVNSTPLIQALALFAVVKSLSPMTSQILISRGKADVARRQSLWGLAILPPAFIAASHWGALAVALVWSTVYPFLVLYQVHQAARDIELSLSTILRRLSPVILSTLGMAGGVLGVQTLLETGGVHPGVRLAVCIAVGGAVYLSLLWVLARDRLRVAYAFIRTRS